MPLSPVLLVVACLGTPLFQDELAPNLELALEEIREESLRSDLEFLAADELGGRDTPSHGLEVAALFLRARLQRLGFEAPDGVSWFSPFVLVDRSLDLEASFLTFASEAGRAELVFGSDYFLSRTNHVLEREARGPAVSVGSGSKGEFEAAALEGAWAIVFDTGISVRRATRYAEKAGAVGVLILESLEVSKPFEQRFRSQTRIALQPNVAYRAFSSRRADEEPPLLMGATSVRERLLALARRAEDPTPPAAGTVLGVEIHERRALVGADITVKNVAGLWRGSDPALAREVIVVSAHYDHVGTRDGDVYNGADDNASGTAGLLGIAEALAAYGPLRRSVLLLWVSGEEKGLWGSHAWATAPVLPDGFVPVADINVDMIGRTRPDELYVTPSVEHASYNALSRAAYELSPLEGFPRLESQDQDWARSDHFNFDKVLQIPVAFLSAGEHADYHEPTDTADKIDFGKLRRITRLVVRMLDRVQDKPLKRTGG